jgi:hypothetical protein
VVAQPVPTTAAQRITPAVSMATGGLMPGIDLADLVAAAAAG